MKESLKVTFFLSTLSDKKELAPTNASVSIFQEEMDSCMYDTSIIVVVCPRLRNNTKKLT